MSDRSYRLLFGFVLLASLYLQFEWVVYALIVVAVVEGLTTQRIPTIVSRFRSSVGRRVLMPVNLTFTAG